MNVLTAYGRGSVTRLEIEANPALIGTALSTDILGSVDAPEPLFSPIPVGFLAGARRR